MKITFLGLGIMGSRMAANLLKSGVNLTVWNRTPAAVNTPELTRAKSMVNLQDSVRDADVVYSMLSTPEVVRECFFGEDGAMKAMKANALWVDCTTVNPSFTRTVAEEAQKMNIQFFDAPVAGSKPQAEAAQLAFFVGANDAKILPIKPHLEAMGAKVVPFGKVGLGSAYKMLVNVMLAQSMVIFSESVLLGEALGLDRNFLLDMIPSLPVIAPFTKFKKEAMRNDDYPVNFPLEWMHKDLHLATLTAYEADQPLYLANLTKEIYAGAKRDGMGRLDFSAVHRYLKSKQG